MKVIDLKEVDGIFVPVGEAQTQAQPRPRTRPPKEKKPRRQKDQTVIQVPVKARKKRTTGGASVHPEYTEHNPALDDFMHGISQVVKLFGGIR